MSLPDNYDPKNPWKGYNGLPEDHPDPSIACRFARRKEIAAQFESLMALVLKNAKDYDQSEKKPETSCIMNGDGLDKSS